jgi:hypothetical protein
MRATRANLLKAIKLYPKQILDKKFIYVIYVFMQTLLGNKLYFTVRKIKRYIQKRPIDD